MNSRQVAAKWCEMFQESIAEFSDGVVVLFGGELPKWSCRECDELDPRLEASVSRFVWRCLTGKYLAVNSKPCDMRDKFSYVNIHPTIDPRTGNH